MIMKFHNYNINFERLRQETKTTRQGTSAYNIIKVSNKHGFEAFGLKCEIEDLEKLEMPLIAHTKINEMFHFIVIYKINDKLLIADPSEKIKTITKEKFKEIWTGIVLDIKPIFEFEKKKEPKAIVKLIKTIDFKIKKLISLSIIINIITVILSSYFIVFKQTTNKNIFLIFLTMLLIKTILDIIKNKILINLRYNIDKTVTNDIISRFLKLPYSFYSTRTSGEVVSRFNDLYNLKDFIIKMLFVLFLELPLLIISLIIMIKISIELTLLILTSTFFYTLTIIKTSENLENKIKETKDAQENSQNLIIEMSKSYETIKGMQIENKVNDKFQKTNETLLKNIKDLDKIDLKQQIEKELNNGIFYLILNFYGFILIKNNLMTIEVLITFNMLASLFIEPIKSAINYNYTLKETKESIKRINDIYIDENLKENDKEAVGEIEFKNVEYSYDDVKINLDKINLKIKEGEKIMIYGENGSGKSTILKLIMKFLEKDNGEILIDKEPIEEYNINNYLKGIAYLSQNDNLLSGTILENLFTTEKEKIEEISKICKIDNFIKERTLNYKIKDNLSGGEKQRIMLLRTLLKPFNILLIDEGLSEVDIKTEKQILKNLFNKYKYQTIIIVSHRMDNAHLFDKCYEIKKGKL